MKKIVMLMMLMVMVMASTAFADDAAKETTEHKAWYETAISAVCDTGKTVGSGISYAAGKVADGAVFVGKKVADEVTWEVTWCGSKCKDFGNFVSEKTAKIFSR